MVIKSSKLSARKKKYFSSESDSSLVFSESSNESLPVLKPNAQIQESGTSKPISDGIFKSPVHHSSSRLEMDKNKVTRTYGSKFVAWESIACSTPLTEKPACLKYTPFSPITSIPSPSEFLEEQCKENSNDWCTYLQEEVKSSSKERPSESAAIAAPQNRGLASEKESKNPSPFANVSPKEFEEVNEVSLKHINKISPEQRNSRIAGSGSKNISGSIRNLNGSIKINEKPVSNNSNVQHVEHEATLKVASVSSSSAGSKTHKKKAVKHTETVHTNATGMKRTLTEVHKKRVTRNSKICEEYISDSPAHSKKPMLANNVMSPENEVGKNLTIVNEKQKENGDKGNISSRKHDNKHDNSNRNAERFGNMESEIISEVVDKIPGSTEELQQTVTSKIQDASQKSHANGKNLNPSRYRKTRIRFAKKPVNTDIVEDKQSVNSENITDVSTTSEDEEPNVSRMNLVTVHPVLKAKEKDAELSGKQERNSIQRLSAGDVNCEHQSDVSTSSEVLDDNRMILRSVNPDIKSKDKEVTLSWKLRRNSIKKLGADNVDTAKIQDASQKSHENGKNLNPSRYRKTRIRFAKKSNSVNTDIVEDKKSVNSDNITDVSTTSEDEESNVSRMNLVTVHSVSKAKEKEAQLSGKQERNSIQRLSAGNVNSEKFQDASQKSHENGKNLNPSRYRKTRIRFAKKSNSVNTDIVEDKKSVNSENITDVSTTSEDEEPNVSRMNLVTVHSVSKAKEKEAQLSGKQKRNSIQRLSAGDVNSESQTDASTTSEEPNNSRLNLLPVHSVVKTKEKEIQSSANKQRNNSVKRLSSGDVDTGVRKSKRQRLPPLKYWKGERAQYKLIDHPECKTLYSLVGVIRPRVSKGEHQKKKQTHAKMVVRPKKNMSSLAASVSTDNVKEIIPMRIGSKMQDVECVAHFSKSAFEPFLLSSGENVKGMTYQPCLSMGGLANGILKITAGGSHQSEVNESVDLLMFVIKGSVDVTINDYVVHGRPGCSVIIPRGVEYKVGNNSSYETLLLFVTKMQR